MDGDILLFIRGIADGNCATDEPESSQNVKQEILNLTFED